MNSTYEYKQLPAWAIRSGFLHLFACNAVVRIAPDSDEIRLPWYDEVCKHGVLQDDGMTRVYKGNRYIYDAPELLVISRIGKIAYYNCV